MFTRMQYDHPTQLRLLAVSECRGRVSEPDCRAAKLLTVDLRGKQGHPAGRLEPGSRPLPPGAMPGVRLNSGAVAAAEKVAASTSVARRMK